MWLSHMDCLASVTRTIPGCWTNPPHEQSMIGDHHPEISGWWARATPLKNMISSIGKIRNPILMGKYNWCQPNHQPVFETNTFLSSQRLKRTLPVWNQPGAKWPEIAVHSPSMWNGPPQQKHSWGSSWQGIFKNLRSPRGAQMVLRWFKMF